MKERRWDLGFCAPIQTGLAEKQIFCCNVRIHNINGAQVPLMHDCIFKNPQNEYKLPFQKGNTQIYYK